MTCPETITIGAYVLVHSIRRNGVPPSRTSSPRRLPEPSSSSLSCPDCCTSYLSKTSRTSRSRHHCNCGTAGPSQEALAAAAAVSRWWARMAGGRPPGLDDLDGDERRRRHRHHGRADQSWLGHRHRTPDDHLTPGERCMLIVHGPDGTVETAGCGRPRTTTGPTCRPLHRSRCTTSTGSRSSPPGRCAEARLPGYAVHHELLLEIPVPRSTWSKVLPSLSSV